MRLLLLLRWIVLPLVLAAPGAAPGFEPKPGAIRPRERILLFNGKDLAGLSTWLSDTKAADPRRVFRVQDGVIRISGEGSGYLATREAYRDYHLVVEYRWGQRTDGGNSVRNSGILLHATGPDGGAGGDWMPSIECQLAQGCVGDLIPIRGKDEQGREIQVQFVGEVSDGPDRRPRWTPGGQARTFSKGQMWWSRHDPEFKEVIDTRGKDDVESRLGQWTRIDCRCAGDRITVQVNGTTVNECRGAFPSEGKILLQSEGFELHVRRFELQPLDP